MLGFIVPSFYRSIVPLAVTGFFVLNSRLLEAPPRVDAARPGVHMSPRMAGAFRSSWESFPERSRTPRPCGLRLTDMTDMTNMTAGQVVSGSPIGMRNRAWHKKFVRSFVQLRPGF